MADTFPSQFKGDIVTPDHSTDYQVAISRWAVNAQRQAKIVAFVKDAEDVSIALKYARENKLPIAIRGGGHSAAGASSVEGGLVVDLSRYLSSARIDPEKRLGYVGGGALWGTVEAAAIEHGLATVGGTVNHTGVGGLTLGGGYGFLTGLYGLTIDNLVQATVVLADGSITTASETENPDLFFALRGGGSNFGICTEFVYRLHPQRRTVFAGNLIFPPTALEKIVNLIAEWEKNITEKEFLIHALTVTPDKKPIVALTLFYNGSESEGRENYKSFFDLGPLMDTTREMGYEVSNTLANKKMDHNQYTYMTTAGQLSPNYTSAQQLLDGITKVAAETNIRPVIAYEYLSLKKVMEVPNGTTAFIRQETRSVTFIFSWTEETEGNAELSRKTINGMKELVRAVQPNVDSETKLLGYGNTDADAVDSSLNEDKARLVFGENYERLQKIKKKYDPDVIFNKWFPIVPA